MANGWAPDGAVQEQIEDSVKDALASARARMPSGAGSAECEECGRADPGSAPPRAARRAHLCFLPVGSRQAPDLFRDQPARQQGQPTALSLRQ